MGISINQSIIAGYTSAITIVHLETQNNYKLKVKSSIIKQVKFLKVVLCSVIRMSYVFKLVENSSENY